MIHVMQYRVQRNDSAQWSLWTELPEQLSFTNTYLPERIQFRALEIAGTPFMFREAIKEEN